MDFQLGDVNHPAALICRLERADERDDGVCGFTRVDICQAIGSNSRHKALSLFDLHRAMAEHHAAWQAWIVPIGYGGRDEPARPAEFAVGIVIRRFGHRTALITAPFERPSTAVDTVIEAIGALHAVRDGDFADGTGVCLEESDRRVRRVPFGRDADVVRLRFDVAHSHQPAQRIEGMWTTAKQGGLGCDRVDAPVVGGAVVDDVVVIVQVFAFAVENRPQITGPQQRGDVCEAGRVAHLIAHLVGQSMAFREGDNLLAFVYRQRHRDFAQHVFAGLQRHDGMRAVQVIGRGDDDCVDTAVRQDRVDVGMHGSHVVLYCDALCQRLVGITDGHYPAIGEHLEGL